MSMLYGPYSLVVVIKRGYTIFEFDLLLKSDLECLRQIVNTFYMIHFNDDGQNFHQFKPLWCSLSPRLTSIPGD